MFVGKELHGPEIYRNPSAAEGLSPEEIPALFETAGGVTTSAPIYWAMAQLGQSNMALVRLRSEVEAPSTEVASHKTPGNVPKPTSGLDVFAHQWGNTVDA